MSSRLVVVTGGAQGLGRATSLAFASKGHYVVAADISEAHGASLEQEAVEADLALTFVRADFRLPEACADVADAARRWARSSAAPGSAQHVSRRCVPRFTAVSAIAAVGARVRVCAVDPVV